ncbi:hypothetical protein [Amycolatopsis sp. cmx-11-51]
MNGTRTEQVVLKANSVRHARRPGSLRWVTVRRGHTAERLAGR